MRHRRLIIALAVLLLVAAVTTLLWTALDWPPPRLILKHGLPLAGGPTGKTWENDFGMEFVEIEPGYFPFGSHYRCDAGNALGRFCRQLGLPWGRQPRHRRIECPREWAEVPAPVWIQTTEVTVEQLELFLPAREQRKDEPATYATWHQAITFCKWLSARTPGRYRLPTEQEWEYIATSALATLKGEPHPSSLSAARSGESERQITFGLSGMPGRVAEWCQDAAPMHYPLSRAGIGGLQGAARRRRVVRDAKPLAAPEDLTPRAAIRMSADPDVAHPLIGFRTVWIPDNGN